MSKTNVTVVLAHGAWADGSSWNEVTRRLLRKEIAVVAAPLPLTSLRDDVAAIERTIERTLERNSERNGGPVVLVAHAYAGTVISASVHERVRALVFAAALTPDEGETVAELFYRAPPHRDAPQLAPDAHGLIWMPEASFAKAFAQHASPEQAALFAATQRPIALQCIQERAPAPAWKTKPSWFLLAEEDRMIHPGTQRFMAERMGARIRSEPLDHTPLATAPERVVSIIEEALANL